MNQAAKRISGDQSHRPDDDHDKENHQHHKKKIRAQGLGIPTCARLKFHPLPANGDLRRPI